MSCVSPPFLISKFTFRLLFVVFLFLLCFVSLQLLQLLCFIVLFCQLHVSFHVIKFYSCLYCVIVCVFLFGILPIFHSYVSPCFLFSRLFSVELALIG